VVKLYFITFVARSHQWTKEPIALQNHLSQHFVHQPQIWRSYSAGSPVHWSRLQTGTWQCCGMPKMEGDIHLQNTKCGHHTAKPHLIGPPMGLKYRCSLEFMNVVIFLGGTYLTHNKVAWFVSLQFCSNFNIPVCG